MFVKVTNCTFQCYGKPSKEIDMDFFKIVVQSEWCHGLPEESLIVLSQSVATEMVTAIQAWYDGLDVKVRLFVREVSILASFGREYLHVSVKTDLGSEKFRQLQDGTGTFLYNPETKLGGSAGSRDKLVLKEALDQALRVILGGDIGFLQYTARVLEAAVMTLNPDGGERID